MEGAMVTLSLGSRLAAIREGMTVRAFQVEDATLFVDDAQAASTLRELLSHGPDEAYLLPRRMEALGIDPDEVARIEPALFTDMHARCTFCECPGPCAWDLAGDMDEAWRDGPDGWQAYCPNAEPLLALCEIPWFRPE
jgi:hypothetical protein